MASEVGSRPGRDASRRSARGSPHQTLTLRPPKSTSASHVFPEQSSVGEAALRFAELPKERSEGRIEVQVFPAGQLGGDDAIGRELSRGTIQLAFVNPNSMVGIDPLFDVHIPTFIAQSYEEAERHPPHPERDDGAARAEEPRLFRERLPRHFELAASGGLGG
ncbi:hypothetical protein [Paracoccus sp. (in: a-proteobacteria)]|uniref:hypothetical protein n=1 Tax=Paracoccus sp. TaxID=267 RepID=UPI0026E0E8C0|nr:hypothetical protein [Paracoccus sp. (in: a-proteobacteria)]MDO5371782.1 hypothetical protein [Paracoccus sp. (in: a-proteobacteria)]